MYSSLENHWTQSLAGATVHPFSWCEAASMLQDQLCDLDKRQKPSARRLGCDAYAPFYALNTFGVGVIA